MTNHGYMHIVSKLFHSCYDESRIFARCFKIVSKLLWRITDICTLFQNCFRVVKTNHGYMHFVSKLFRNCYDESRIFASCFKIVSDLLRRTTDICSEILTQQAPIVTNYLLRYVVTSSRVQKLWVLSYEAFLAVGHVKFCQGNLSLSHSWQRDRLQEKNPIAAH